MDELTVLWINPDHINNLKNLELWQDFVVAVVGEEAAVFVQSVSLAEDIDFNV